MILWTGGLLWQTQCPGADPSVSQVWSPLSTASALPLLHQEICVCLCFVVWQMKHRICCDFFFQSEIILNFWGTAAQIGKLQQLINHCSGVPATKAVQPLLCDETSLSAAPSPRLSNEATAVSSFCWAVLCEQPLRIFTNCCYWKELQRSMWICNVKTFYPFKHFSFLLAPFISFLLSLSLSTYKHRDDRAIWHYTCTVHTYHHTVQKRFNTNTPTTYSQYTIGCALQCRHYLSLPISPMLGLILA